MKINKLEIRNYRGLNKTFIEIGDKNILTGKNGIGKSNFLRVLEKIFNWKERRKPLISEDSTFNNNDNIVFSIELNWDSNNTIFNEQIEGKYITSIDNNQLKTNINFIYIYNKKDAEYELKIIIGELDINEALSLGVDLTFSDQKDKVILNGFRKFFIDELFNVIIIAPWNNLPEISEEYIKKYIDNEKDKDGGVELPKHFKELTNQVNEKISNIMSDALTEDMKNLAKILDTKKSVGISSKFKFSSMHKSTKITLAHSLEGYEKQIIKGSDGEERLLSFVAGKTNFDDHKMNLFLIEEPENHMHVGIKRKFTNMILGSKKNDLSFITTHSPELVNLTNNETTLFNLKEDKEFNKGFKIVEKVDKYIYQSNINQILFADKVIFVEGHSEEYLLKWFIKNNIKLKDKYSNTEIINVHGVDFKPFVKLCLINSINYLVFTDNDIFGNTKKYMGLKRAYEIALISKKGIVPSILKELNDKKWELTNERTESIVKNQNTILKYLKENHIFIQESEYKDTSTLENEYVKYNIFKPQQVNQIKKNGKLKFLVKLLSEIDDDHILLTGTQENIEFPILKALF